MKLCGEGKKPILRDVDIEAVGIAAPATKKLEFVIGVARSRGRRGCTTTEAMTRVKLGVKAAARKIAFEARDERGAGEGGAIQLREQECVWGFGVDSKEEGKHRDRAGRGVGLGS